MIEVILLTFFFGVPPGTMIDRVVAVVDKEVIVQSELLAEARIALAMREGDQAANADLDADFLSSFRVYLIDQLLVAAQARRVGGTEVSEFDVDQALRAIEQRFKSSAAYAAFLRRFGIPPVLVRDTLRRDLRNEKYINERIRMRLAGQEFSEGDQTGNFGQALGSWLAELQAGAEIRLANSEGELQLQRGSLAQSAGTLLWK